MSLYAARRRQAEEQQQCKSLVVSMPTSTASMPTVSKWEQWAFVPSRQRIGPDGEMVGSQPALRSWTGELMTTRFFLIHFLVEFLGTAFMVFMNCNIQSSPDPNRTDVAFYTSAAYGAVRYFRPSATLDPLQTLIPELLIFNMYASCTGMIKIIGSIACQILGALFGAYMSYYNQGSDSALFAANLTMPAAGAAVIPAQMFLFDALFCFGIGCVSFAYIGQLIKDWEDNHMPTSTSRTDTEGDLQLVPKLEGVTVAVVLFTAIASQYYTTRGSFIITRSLGQAIILNTFTNLGWYFLGQVVGQVSACFVIWFLMFRR